MKYGMVILEWKQDEKQYKTIHREALTVTGKIGKAKTEARKHAISIGYPFDGLNNTDYVTLSNMKVKTGYVWVLSSKERIDSGLPKPNRLEKVSKFKIWLTRI